MKPLTAKPREGTGPVWGPLKRVARGVLSFHVPVVGPTRVLFEVLWRAVQPKEFDLHVRLNLGGHSAVIYAADLTEAYVDFNKGDVTDPSTLGG